MKRIPLTRGKFTLVDDADFERLSKFKWWISRGYVIRYIKLKSGKKRIIWMHRIILKPPKELFTDHIDGNTLNNQRYNLRCANFQQNKANSKIPSNNTSGYKGVSWDEQKQRWLAYIKVNGKQINLLRYRNPVDAAKAYNEAAVKYFGEFARLNPV